MPYPRLLKLDDKTKESLSSYLRSVLLNHKAERGPWQEQNYEFQKEYWAEPTTKEATFPFKGASTIVIPISAIAVETIHARNMTQMFAFGESGFISAKAMNPNWEPVTGKFERYYSKELIHGMGFRKTMDNCLLENTKFGCMVGKSGYKRVVKRVVRYIGDESQDFEVTTQDGATIDYVPISRFLLPFIEQDPQLSQWVGEEHSASPYELQLLENSGMFYPGTIIDVDTDDEVNPLKKSKLSAYYLANPADGFSGGAKADNEKAALENRKPVFPERLEWVEVWLGFDVDEDNKPEEIVVHFHEPSGTIMAAWYNWYDDLFRPYRTGQYFPIEGRWTGIGVCKMNQQFQREITMQHRARIDNSVLANTRMIVVHKLSGYGPGEPIFPGKMWFVDDMSHVNVLQMADVYQSSYANEQSALIYSQQRSGVHEATLGMPQGGTPGTATSDLARIQEGNKKYDYMYGNCKEFANHLVMDGAANIQMFGARTIEYFTEGEAGPMIAQVFSMPQASIRKGIHLELSVASQQQNKLLDRQNWQQIAQHIVVYYKSQLEIAMLLGNQQLVQLITQRALFASTEALRQILDSFDVRNIERILIREFMEMGAPNGNNGSDPNAALNGGPNNGSQGNIQSSGMDGFASLISGAGPSSNGGASRLLNNGASV